MDHAREKEELCKVCIISQIHWPFWQWVVLLLICMQKELNIKQKLKIDQRVWIYSLRRKIRHLVNLRNSNNHSIILQNFGCQCCKWLHFKCWNRLVFEGHKVSLLAEVLLKVLVNCFKHYFQTANMPPNFCWLKRSVLIW